MYVIVTCKGLSLKLWWCGGHLKLRLSHVQGWYGRYLNFTVRMLKLHVL